VSALLAACGGFLLAVLWMDLIFDVQVLRHPDVSQPLPEPVLASIAAYYRRATTDSAPMSRLIAAVMAVGVLGCGVQVFRGEAPLPLRLAAFALLFAPVALAAARIVPDAVQLGARSDPAELQSALARRICRGHLVCFAGIAAFVLLQICA
jgi:hypothetical protein